MFATKTKLLTAVSAGALALGAAGQASASINPDTRTAPSVRSVRVLAGQRPSQFHATGTSGSESPAITSPEAYGVSQSTLDAIAACESGGNPAAVSPDGTYRGKYQFDYSTWASAGGTGDPAAAPEAEQDMRAAMLLSRAGTSPWPICG